MTNKISLRTKSSRFFFLAGLLAITAFTLVSPSAVEAALYRELEVGSTGADVGELQMFLAKDPTMYPQGLVTSYFGSMTKSAVAVFQSRNDLPAVGRVGPMTLPVLRVQMAGGVIMGGVGVNAPAIFDVRINRNSTSANISWNTNEFARGLIYYSASPLTTSESPHAVSVSGQTAFTDSTFRSSQNVSLSGLQKDTVYYYLIHTTDQDGNVSVTWPASFRTDN